jgi:hypothetical protein
MSQVAGPSRKRSSRIQVSDSEEEAPRPVSRAKRRKTTPEDDSDLDEFDSDEERRAKPQIKRQSNGHTTGRSNGHVIENPAAYGGNGASGNEDADEEEEDNMEDIAGESAVVAFRPEYQRDSKDRCVTAQRT